MNICKECNKEFKNSHALAGHMKVHKATYEQHKLNNQQSSANSAARKKLLNIKLYLEQPSTCNQCNAILPYKIRHNKFCNHSCSASYNNALRDKEYQKRQSQKLKEFFKKNPKPKRKFIKQPKQLELPLKLCRVSKTDHEIIGPYSKVWLTKCAHCNTIFNSRLQQKYCNNHAHLYKNRNRNRYAFTFSLSKHPNLFGQYSELLKEHGMWSYSNTNGLTRDHRVSVNEAIRYNYDPYYIKHPCNCELMSWVENNKKKTKSSISYNELKQLVDEYNNK